MRAKRAAGLLLAAGLALAGCTGQSAVAQGSGRDDTRYVGGDGSVTRVAPAERAPAPALSGETVDGAPLDLADLRGQVVVLNVWASWCGPCRAEAPALERVAGELRSRGVRFVGLNTRDNPVAAEGFERSYDISYPSLRDDDGRLQLAFRDTLPPAAIPSTLVLDRQGRVAARHLGPVTLPRLRALIEPVVAEPAP